MALLFPPASNAQDHDELVGTSPSGFGSVSEAPETGAVNHFIPLVPAGGLGELRHHRRAEFDLLEDEMSYSLRRYLSSLPPNERESQQQVRQNESNWLRQDPFLLSPTRQATEGSHGKHSRPHSMGSASHKSNASGWMNFDLDPTSASGGWMMEDSDIEFPRIIDEDALDEGHQASHLTGLNDIEELQGLIAERNRLLNLSYPEDEHNKDWKSEESSQPDSEKNSLSRSVARLCILPEDTCTPPLVASEDELENTDVPSADVPKEKVANFSGAAKDIDGDLEAHKLTTAQVEHVQTSGALEDSQLYPYRPLDSQHEGFRVALLRPTEDYSAPICCDLIEVTLSDHPDYDALFYARGNPEKQASLLVAGVEFKVTVNLELALRYLRLQDRPRILWADAICIDQNNIGERNMQIQLMQDIYNSSITNLIWLGEASEKEAVELLALKLTGNSQSKAVVLDIGNLPRGYMKGQGATLSPSWKPRQPLLARPSLTEVAGSIPGSPIPDKTTYQTAEIESSEYTTEDSGQDDSSEYSQSNNSPGAVDGFIDESSVLGGSGTSSKVLNNAKSALVNKLMQDVWGFFDKSWAAQFTACGGSAPTSSSPKQKELMSTHGVFQKRQRQEDNDDNSSGDDNGRAPKRSQPNQTPSDGIDDQLALACPFRKHDPRKYRFPQYKPCVLSSWNSVGRVKEHIYRRHRVPIHCTRCWMVFDSEDLLVIHSREDMNRCQVQPQKLLDGITPATERLLRSRKGYKGQSEPERWKTVYRILFPDEIVPSPYYEAVLDENANDPEAHERTNYDEYYRRELPRLIRSRLESTVDSQLQALESALRTQIDNIIQDCMDQLSTNYEAARARAAAADSNIGATALPAPIALRTINPQLPAESHHRHEQSNSTESVPELQPAFDYFTSLNQSPGLPPTPADLSLHYGPFQSNGMSDRAFSNIDQDNLATKSHAGSGCYCPVNACNCPGQHDIGQLQNQYLPSFEFDTPTKILERGSLPEEWDPNELSANAGMGIDDVDINWQN